MEKWQKKLLFFSQNASILSLGENAEVGTFEQYHDNTDNCAYFSHDKHNMLHRLCALSFLLCNAAGHDAPLVRPV